MRTEQYWDPDERCIKTRNVPEDTIHTSRHCDPSIHEDEQYQHQRDSIVRHSTLVELAVALSKYKEWVPNPSPAVLWEDVEKAFKECNMSLRDVCYHDRNQNVIHPFADLKSDGGKAYPIVRRYPDGSLLLVCEGGVNFFIKKGAQSLTDPYLTEIAQGYHTLSIPEIVGRIKAIVDSHPKWYPPYQQPVPDLKPTGGDSDGCDCKCCRRNNTPDINDPNWFNKTLNILLGRIHR